MQAIILAAGMGKRLQELTASNTKCMVKVNGETLISRVLHQLDKLALRKVIIVTGYEGAKLKNYIETLTDISTQIQYVDNPVYDKTNNIYSLALAKDFLLEDDTLLLESDLIFEDGLIASLLEDSRPNLALVDKFESWMDGTVVKLDDNDNIKEFIPGKRFDYKDKENCYKTVNAYKFSKEFSKSYYVPFLNAYMMALGNNEYYEQVLRVITLLDDPIIQGKRISGQRWYEIDDIQDLNIAESLFANDNQQYLEKISSRYGGYWRYPKMLDFCYLVNPYYPPRKLIDEMQASFTDLLTQYPSGMEINSIIAARNFSVHKENIVVGNGAAEMIKIIMEDAEAGGMITGLIRPTFEEYANRGNKENQVVFTPDNDDFSYTAEDLMMFFENKNIRQLIIINPDNPSGNYIDKSEILSLIKWCDSKSIRLILDESFVDFTEEGEVNSFINQSVLEEFKTLVIVKSISKSYGVPGVRLGVALSGDETFIAKLKKQASIWNINSFGEFFMQIQEKYSKNYTEALKKFREARSSYIKELQQIPHLRVIPSQANYVMCELTGEISASHLAEQLLADYNILIKDLTGKIKNGRQYVRLAVRNIEDNTYLVHALKEIL